MSLVFGPDEVLVEGVHPATLSEIEELLGRYSRCNRRPDLWEKFLQYAECVRRTEWPCEVILDGSFVMPRVYDPDDIDVILGYPLNVVGMQERDELRPYQLNVIDPSYCKRTYKIDLKACVTGDASYLHWSGFFCQVSMKRADRHLLPEGSRKGIIRVLL